MYKCSAGSRLRWNVSENTSDIRTRRKHLLTQFSIPAPLDVKADGGRKSGKSDLTVWCLVFCWRDYLGINKCSYLLTCVLLVFLILLTFIIRQECLLVENRLLVKFIRNYIWDSSAYFPYPYKWGYRWRHFPPLHCCLCKNTLVYIIKRKVHGSFKKQPFTHLLRMFIPLENNVHTLAPTLNILYFCRCRSHREKLRHKHKPKHKNVLC